MDFGSADFELCVLQPEAPSIFQIPITVIDSPNGVCDLKLWTKDGVFEEARWALPPLLALPHFQELNNQHKPWAFGRVHAQTQFQPGPKALWKDFFSSARPYHRCTAERFTIHVSPREHGLRGEKKGWNRIDRCLRVLELIISDLHQKSLDNKSPLAKHQMKARVLGQHFQGLLLRVYSS